MGRYLGPACRLCRREKTKLFLKGNRCSGPKCTLAKREVPPGQHGQRGTKLSNYGVQLREKQKLKRMYGLLEKQFRRYFLIASKKKGVTGRTLLQLLERRLDNVVFRLGFAVSRMQARQVVSHNIIYINNHRVNIPSYLVREGDLVTIKNAPKTEKLVHANLELSKDRGVPEWLGVDATKLQATIKRLPQKEDIPAPIKEQLIVELYSK